MLKLRFWLFKTVDTAVEVDCIMILLNVLNFRFAFGCYLLNIAHHLLELEHFPHSIFSIGTTCNINCFARGDSWSTLPATRCLCYTRCCVWKYLWAVCLLWKLYWQQWKRYTWRQMFKTWVVKILYSFMFRSLWKSNLCRLRY